MIRSFLALFLFASQIVFAQETAPTEKGVGLFVHGDWLYWKSRMTNLPVCDSGTSLGLGSYINQSILSVPFGYHSGFSVGAGYTVPVVEWDLLVDWTYYRNQASRSENAGFMPEMGIPDRLLTPIWSNFSYTAQLMHASQSLHYNVFDFLFRKTVIENKHTKFKGFGGVKVAWIKESLKINFDHLTISSTFNPSAYDRQYIKNKFKGAGLSFGFSTDFDFTYGFGTSIEGALSLLAGTFYFKKDQTYRASTTLLWDGAWSQKSIALNGDLRLQLYWEKEFSSQRFCKFFAEYDLSYWPDQIQVTTTSTRFGNLLEAAIQTQGHGSLSLYGYRLGAQVRF